MARPPRITPQQRVRLQALDQRLFEIASWLAPARLLNPTQASRQRALAHMRSALQRGDVIDPVFDYLPLPHDAIDASQDALDALDFGDTPLDDLLREQAQALLLQLDLLRARGTHRFDPVAVRIYGLPDQDLLRLARDILQGDTREAFPPPPSARPPSAPPSYTTDAPTMASEMRAALGRMGIRGWQVVLMQEMSARMSVSARHRQVRVKADSVFSRDDRDRLIVHELGVHVRRACNGFATGLLNLGLGLPRYIATEEGLASHMEQQHGLLRPQHLDVYAWRALGASFAHQMGFANTFRELVRMGATPSLAWDVTLRVKRGLVHTRQPGAFPKDYVYLDGRQRVARYIADGHPEDALFLGKIAIEDIPRVQALLAWWNPDAPSPPAPRPALTRAPLT